MLHRFRNSELSLAKYDTATKSVAKPPNNTAGSTKTKNIYRSECLTVIHKLSKPEKVRELARAAPTHLNAEEIDQALLAFTSKN
jgi:hypothetical protein